MVVEVACEACGLPFETKRSTARFCSNSCRAKASAGKVVARKRPAPEPGSAAVALETAGGDPGAPLVAETLRALTEAGRVDTELGQLALLLARRVAAPYEQGNAVASLSREFRTALEQALAGAAAAVDPLDELRARRDVKRVV